KVFLSKSDVPIPIGEIFDRDDEQEIFSYAEKIHFPIIIKPTSGSMGRGVYTNINSIDELKNALEDFKKRYKYKSIIVEKHYFGQEYRIYVVGDKVIGATNRVPANIEGDGKSTVHELIKNKNEMRKANPYLAPKPMKIDYEIRNSLKNNGLSLESILSKNEILSLREKSNLSTGGDPLEATDELTEEVKQIAVDALKALPSIPHAGVDIIVDPEDNTKGVVLEANATAEIAFHMFPWEGNPKDVPRAIIDYYFPETKDNQRSLSYFDYKSILAPLNTWAADSVTVSPVSQEKLHGKQYNVVGKVQKVGYMNYIRRQALKKGLYGHSLKRDSNEIEIFLVGSEQSELDDFIDICYKGSKKSKVDYVKEKDINIENKPFKIGFEVITE